MTKYNEHILSNTSMCMCMFRYVGPVLHYGDSTVLLGDAIHTVKPYFGLGVNSAFEDVISLRAALDAEPLDPGRALEAFSEARLSKW